jgi:hypothetical protein
MAWYGYMSNMGIDKRYSKYFDKCNRKMCHFVGMLNACASRSFKVDGIQMSLWRLAWLTCMQNVGALMMLRECSTRCHHTMWSLGTPYYGDMLNVGKAEGTGTISMNAAGMC